MTRIAMKMSVAAAAVAVFAASAPASAVQNETVAVAVKPSPRAERADALKQQAEGLFAQPKQWRKAARLLERSAELRDAADPDAYTCLMFAGRLRAAVGDYAAARSSLEKAAAHAMARGAVLEAANAYIDAAFAAAEDKQPEAAKELLARAALLTESPLLSQDQADQITRRISA
jgi:hypothetical protein